MGKIYTLDCFIFSVRYMVFTLCVDIDIDAIIGIPIRSIYFFFGWPFEWSCSYNVLMTHLVSWVLNHDVFLSKLCKYTLFNCICKYLKILIETNALIFRMILKRLKSIKIWNYKTLLKTPACWNMTRAKSKYPTAFQTICSWAVKSKMIQSIQVT